MRKRTKQFFTLLASMHDGDLRPLANAILLGQKIDTPILYYLAGMINSGAVIANGRITVRRPRGRPKKLGKSVLERLVTQYYDEARQTLSHEDALLKVTNRFKLGVDTARKAVTTRRNSEK